MVTTSRVCKDCKENISDLQPQCVRCIECQRKFRERPAKKKAFLDDKKEKKQLEPMGTTDFSQHRETDFNKEAAAIKKEMKNLGLR